jgi:cation:H+ antiporter
MSEFVIGIGLLSVGSNIPELAIAIDAAVRNIHSGDTSGIVVGTAVGSALGQIGFVLGFVGLFAYLTLPRRATYRHGSVMLGSIVLLALVGLDGFVSRTEGAFLIIVYLVYFAYLLTDKSSSAAVSRDDPILSGAKASLYLLFGITVVVVSSEVTVNAAIRIAEALNVDQSLVSIFLIGLGSSLPEMSISLAAVLKKRVRLSVGNLVGSNIFDTLVPIGVAGAISTLDFGRKFLLIDLPVLFALSFVVLFFFVRVRGLQRPEASAVMGIYLAYAFLRVSAGL